MDKKFKLPGGDNFADVFLSGDRILRTYHGLNFLDLTRKILRILESDKNLSQILVPTRILEVGSDSFTLEHQQLSFNLPEYWTLNQYLDVIEKHLLLMQILEKNGLTLKDHLPENFVIHQGKAVFVDFASIVTGEIRENLSWINENRGEKGVSKYFISDMMFPFMLLPLFVGLINSESKMRHMLRYRYCNSGTSNPSWREINFTKLLREFKPTISLRVLSFLTFSRFYRSEIRTLKKAIKLLRLLMNNSDRHSDYLNYYESKNELFNYEDISGWNDKQKSVYEIIKKQKPKIVLDLGCNTGWFSILASKANCEVKSVDVDPVIVDHLYLQAKHNNLNINTSVIDLDTLANFKQITLSENDQSSDVSRMLPPQSFDADLVLALGLVHHLVLGLGYSLELVMNFLASSSRQTLVLEFVELGDEKIVSEESFFPQIQKNRAIYNRENVIKFGMTYFDRVEFFPSNPATRGLLVFTRD